MDRKKIASKAMAKLGKSDVLELTDAYKEANITMKYSAEDILREVDVRLANVMNRAHSSDLSTEEVLAEIEGIRHFLKNR